MAFSGARKYVSCGASAVSGFTSVSSVGTRTSEITKSTMIPTADPTPNDLHGHDVARRERQHAERRRRARAEQRRRQVRDRRLERLLYVAVPPLLVPVLHDVHVVGDRQHDDERHEHAREDVVAEAHQRVEAERPEQADEHGEHRQQRLAPRAEREVDRQHREEQDRRGELALVVERDAVVGLADLEAAVVVGADARRAAVGSTMSWICWMTPPRTSSMRSSSKPTMIAVVEPSSETRSPRIRSSSSARRRMSAGSRVARSVEQRTDVETAVLGIAALQRLDDRRRGQAVDALDGVDALDVAGDRLDRLRACRGQNSRSGESALSAMISARVPPNSVRNRS